MEERYSDRYFEFGQEWDGHDGDDVAKLIMHAAERLAAVVMDEVAVDEAMSSLYRAAGIPSVPVYPREGSWRKLWGDLDGSDFDTFPLGQKLTSLNAYAFWGLSPKGERGVCSIDEIKEVIDLVKRAVGSPSDARPDTPEIDRTLLAAEGRLALDEGRPITLEQLAALARIGLKSVRNAAAPSSGSGLEVSNAAATAESALNWLTARGGFRNSIWSRAGEEETAPAMETIRHLEGEILWVPFASDGSEFHPKTCLRGGGYTVGPKDAEEKIDDYREALARLARMRPAAYWRRPNSANNWGIVTAEAFHPRTAQELGLTSAIGGEK